MPLILLTSLGRQDLHNHAVEPELAALLTKPVKQAQLYEVVRRSLVRPQARSVAAPSTQNGSPAPLGRPAGTPGTTGAAATAAIATTPPAPLLAENIPLRVLLAEDNRVNQRVALKLLERLGYRAELAANGFEVLEAFRRSHYDLILMDVQMPEMDGMEATRRIRREFNQQPYIVALTASALERDREACLQAGMDDYLSKPFRIQELSVAIQRIPRRSP
ncbi:MAG: response regulator [Synechococcales cyanobacterium RM1_1_8]|nr:response regulator [Synechococcales cyanobacterium RM1_1_8]